MLGPLPRHASFMQPAGRRPGRLPHAAGLRRQQRRQPVAAGTHLTHAVMCRSRCPAARRSPRRAVPAPLCQCAVVCKTRILHHHSLPALPLLLLQLLLAMGQRRYAPAGAEGLVSAALAFAPYTEPLQCLGPIYLITMWCADPARGVATGDPDFAQGQTFSQGWGEHRDRMRAWLRGNGSDGSGAVAPLDAVDWAVVNPLWAPAGMLRELPPLTIQVGGWGGWEAAARPRLCSWSQG